MPYSISFATDAYGITPYEGQSAIENATALGITARIKGARLLNTSGLTEQLAGFIECAAGKLRTYLYSDGTNIAFALTAAGINTIDTPITSAGYAQASIVSGDWYLIKLWWDTSATEKQGLKLYTDGGTLLIDSSGANASSLGVFTGYGDVAINYAAGYGGEATEYDWLAVWDGEPPSGAPSEPTDLTSGLIERYACDDGSGTTISGSPNGWDATTTGSVTWNDLGGGPVSGTGTLDALPAMSGAGTQTVTSATGTGTLDARPAMSGTGNTGTTILTKTVAFAGGDYTTLAAAITGELAGKDFVALNRIVILDVYDIGAPEGAVIVSGGTTDATHYLQIQGHDNHLGVWNAGYYRIAVGSAAAGLSIQQAYTRVVGLQVQQSGQGAYGGYGIEIGNYTGIRIERCIVKHLYTGSGTQGYAAGIYASTIYAPVIANNILYGTGRGYGVVLSAYVAALYSNTVYNFDVGFYGGGGSDSIARNDIAATCATAGFQGGWGGTSSNNATSDGSAPGTSNRTGTPTFVSTTSGSEDLHLDASDTVATGYGVDLSADALFAFSNDIDDETRSGTWDIGADEQPATAGDDTGTIALRVTLAGTGSITNPPGVVKARRRLGSGAMARTGSRTLA